MTSTPARGRFFDLRGSFEHAPRTLGLVWRSSRAGTLVIGALTLVAALLPLGVAFAGKRIVDAVVAHDGQLTLHWVAVELALVAALAGASQGLSLTRQVVGARLGLDINLSILEKATTLELRQFEDSEFYDKLTKARREASSTTRSRKSQRTSVSKVLGSSRSLIPNSTPSPSGWK